MTKTIIARTRGGYGINTVEVAIGNTAIVADSVMIIVIKFNLIRTR
jgi:hypothetical protein